MVMCKLLHYACRLRSAKHAQCEYGYTEKSMNSLLTMCLPMVYEYLLFFPYYEIGMDRYVIYGLQLKITIC